MALMCEAAHASPTFRPNCEQISWFPFYNKILNQPRAMQILNLISLFAAGSNDCIIHSLCV